jgi:hypothetical protein
MVRAFQMNPERIAHYEAAGWRAYYDHQWLKMLQLIVALCQEEFHIPFPMSLLAAYYTTRASIAWVPVEHDERKVLGYLEKFYRIAQRYSGLRFNPVYVAQLELQYFEVHRRLVGAADKSQFIETMVELHSALFGISPAQAQASAKLRVLAADIVDAITSKRSSDPERDWERLEEYLGQCYASIQSELAPQGTEVKI